MDKQQSCKITKTFLPRSSPQVMVWGKASLRERERERERVKSLRDFDLEFHTFNNLKCYF